jgi:stage V sporulation protein SpoVS
LPTWLTAIARGAVVCEVSHTRTAPAHAAACQAATAVRDRCGFEALSGLEDAVRPALVELTVDGADSLRVDESKFADPALEAS